MSTKNVTLHDENGNVLLPATKTSRVTDANGTNLDTLLQQAGQVKSISVNGVTQTIDANGNVNIASADGVGIASVVQTTTSSEDGGTNVITVTKTDNTTSTFNIKNGSKGSTGATGPQGERGLPGESGVTGDVSGFTVIQTIDPSATYGATDIAGAATVQATNQELTELSGEVSVIKNEYFKILKNTSFKLFQNVTKGRAFDANGYRNNGNYATCKIHLTAGNYTIPAMTDGYQWELHKYISDTQGEIVFNNFRNTQITASLVEGDYVFTFRNVPTAGTISTWNDTHTAYVNNIEVGIENSSSLEGKLDDEISRSQAVDLTLQQDIVKETQRAKNEEEKTDYKASLIGSDIFGQQEISKNLVPYQLYEAEGYSEGGRYARTRIFPAGVYSISSLAGTGYRYSVFTYVDDTTGTQKITWREGNITYNFVSPFIVNYRNQEVTTLTDEQIDYIDKNHSIVLINDFDLSLSASNGSRIYDYFSLITTEKSYDVTFKSSNNPSEINYLMVFAYAGFTNIGLLAEINIGEAKTITIPVNATRIVFSNLTNVTSDTLLEVNIIESDTTKAAIQSLERSVDALESSVDALNDAVFNPETVVSFCDNISSDVLVEMYFPNITSDWKIIGVSASNNLFRLNLKDSEGVSHYYGEGGNADAQKLQGEYSDTIQTWVDNETSSIIGYFILHYTGTDYSATNNNGYNINISAVTNIDNSPRIKEYLSRKENIVLLGDSLFGYRLQNLLHGFLVDKTDKFIVNAGFPGCRAAWKTANGDDNWDKMSLIGVVDALVSGDFTAISNAIANLSNSYEYFKERLASLKTADLTKPTTVIIEYGNNDITGGNQIGNLWDKTQTIADYDKTKYIEAINYGIAKLSQAFPNIKVIVFNQGWRMIGDTVNPDGGTSGDAIAPYEYTNSAGITFYQYLAAIKENCERCGVRLYDSFRMGGRCAFNWNYYSVDSSHFNVKGYDMLANIIAAQVKEFAG